MADLHVVREHQLGLERARKVARSWADYVGEKLDMRCTVVPGVDGDSVTFERSGVSGQMRVTADRMEIEAKIGLLLKPFFKQIEAETCKRLDAALAKEAAKSAAK